MMDVVRASSDDCIFVILVEDEMDLLCADSGQELPFDALDGASLGDISSVHASMDLNQFEDKGNRFLLFSPCGRDDDAFFRICMKEPCADNIPCAFFNQKTKHYENFNIPAGTRSVDISVGNDGRMMVCWDADEGKLEDDFDTGASDYQDSDEMGDPHKETYDPNEPDGDDDMLGGAKRNGQQELDEIRYRIAQLEDENSQLCQQTSPAAGGPDDDALRSENDRLRRLVSQLADGGYSGNFEQTLDAQIDEQIQNLAQQRRVCQDKQRSLDRLLEERADIDRKVGDVTREINETIELVQKGEGILRESSSQLDETRKLLDEKLQDLGIDEATLRLYQSDQSIDQLLRELNQLQGRVEEKLRTLISARQEDADQRFNRVTS